MWTTDARESRSSSRRKYKKNLHFVNVATARYGRGAGTPNAQCGGGSVLIARGNSQLLLVDMQQRLVPAMANATELIAACGNLLRAAGALGIPVLASEQYRKGLGDTIADLMDLAPGMPRFEKLEFSCYANPALRDALIDAGRPQVILAGIEAHVCVLQTGLELLAGGFQVFVAADAVASRRPESRSLALARLERAGAVPISVEMALFEWLRTAADTDFRNVSRLIR